MYACLKVRPTSLSTWSGKHRSCNRLRRADWQPLSLGKTGNHSQPTLFRTCSNSRATHQFSSKLLSSHFEFPFPVPLFCTRSSVEGYADVPKNSSWIGAQWRNSPPPPPHQIHQ
uniref:Uncharacterized protein n=1 Tax=Opuntia streptacantha TaxID=393608 RepID=A0A7C8ZD63_OPUST